MTIICCICQEAMGDRALSRKKVATSFVWRNHGLCPGCFERARTAIARAYSQTLPTSSSLVNRPVKEVGGL